MEKNFWLQNFYVHMAQCEILCLRKYSYTLYNIVDKGTMNVHIWLCLEGSSGSNNNNKIIFIEFLQNCCCEKYFYEYFICGECRYR